MHARAVAFSLTQEPTPRVCMPSHRLAPVPWCLTLQAKSDRSHPTADASALHHPNNRSNSFRMMR